MRALQSRIVSSNQIWIVSQRRERGETAGVGRSSAKSSRSVSRIGYIFFLSPEPFKLAAYINGRLSAYDFTKAEYSRRLQVRTLQWSPTFFCPLHRRGDTQLLARVGQACHVGTSCALLPAHPQKVHSDTTRMSLALSTDDTHAQQASNNTRPAFPTLSLPCTRRQRVVERKTQLEGMNSSLERRLS